MLKPWTLSLLTELPIVIWENIGFRTEIVLSSSLESSLGSLDISPHQVFSSKMERLWEMVNLLESRCFFKPISFAYTSPKDIPFGAVGRYNSDSSCLHSVDHWVVNVSGFVHFKPKSHIPHHHLILMHLIYLCPFSSFNTSTHILNV
jgi:hypothetical protein